jgi:hypothetical protein
MSKMDWRIDRLHAEIGSLYCEIIRAYSGWYWIIRIEGGHVCESESCFASLVAAKDDAKLAIKQLREAKEASK